MQDREVLARAAERASDMGGEVLTAPADRIRCVDASAHALAARFRALLDGIPDDVSLTLSAKMIRAWLQESPEFSAPTTTAPTATPATWKVWIWTVPEETRIHVPELAEAINVSKSWLYKQTAAKPAERTLPYRRLGGGLVFVVDEIREWIRLTEIVEVPLETVRRRLRPYG